MTKDTLYPPFETKTESSECPNMLLSFELKRSFETVRHIHRSQKVLMTNDASDNVRTNNNEGRVVDKDQRDLDARKFEAAVAAAVAAETEISTLKRGIMELENLLYQESSDVNVIVNANKFPILPAIEDDNN